MKKVSCDVYHFGSTHGPRGRIIKGFVPEYATSGVAAADIRLPEDVEIPPRSTVVVPLRIGFDIPDGWCVKMYPRSSLLPKYGIISPVSIIDRDYSSQEVHAILHNTLDTPKCLQRGDRVLQVMLEKVQEVSEWTRSEKVREGGLGSTGEK